MREKTYLKQRYTAMFYYVGVMLVWGGLLLVSPLLLLLVYPHEVKEVWNFLAPALISGILGGWVCYGCRHSTPMTLSLQEGGVIVLMGWIVVVLFSAWPFVSLPGMDFSLAVFESVSGWTTTGLSVIDVSKASHLILFWRSMMQLAGGAGLAILMMSSLVGATGVGISSAEGRSEQLVPHVRQSARLVLIIYGAYVGIGIVAYTLAGMSLFDAINHTFAAISTGGFSTQADSIGYWNSVAVEAVTLPLMILGNLSFLSAWFLWRGQFQIVSRNGEVRLMAVLIPVSIAILFLLTCKNLYPQLGKAWRVAIFESVSALTTTGFSTVAYKNWNAVGIFVLLVLMLIGGGTCSTAGGIKQFRIYFLWKIAMWELKQALLPRTVVQERPIWEGERKAFLDDARVRQISVFVFLYLLIYGVGVLILCACGFSMQDSLFEFASALGTVGLSVGVTSASMPKPALWAETVAMFLGRLEILVVFVSMIKLCGDGKRMLIPFGNKDG